MVSSMMMWWWRGGRTNKMLSSGVCCVLVCVCVLVYLGFVTLELYQRVQGNRKLIRLKQYEQEVDELTTKLQEYKRDANTVRKSLWLLQQTFDQIITNQKTHNGSGR
ncbi:hypothetical protein Pcinc_024484 [Petrolisthes cinctipes]|uniref:Uncharacterized protein n=1 Tax=Petrolisthes cinctipes TaxID=88211 RepID=A0AAE1F9U2_PETCI|nr:hypothetical protein Pcinc_024484 [Petrolisthes cinctipes]